MTTDIDAILRQRAELKARDPGTILLFRVEDHHGDLYRAYGEDARGLRDIVGYSMLSIEYHHHGTAGDWTGAPADQLENLLGRIVRAGGRAAVCEPVAAAEAQGRPVERVVVPGEAGAGHTEPPWEIESGPTPDGTRRWIVGPDGETIAEMSPDISDDAIVGANARLIVAAPKLLAACRFAIEALGRQAESYPRDAIIARVIDDIEAAVREAEGE